MNEFEPRALKSAMIRGMAEGMVSLVRHQGEIDSHEVQAGLRGEALPQRRSDVRHTNGDRAARIAQQQ